MASPRDQFGGAAPSGSGLAYEIIRLKDGVYTPPLRILPAMHSLRLQNKWCDFHGIHFGYKVKDKKDPTKDRMRPFECIQVKNYKTKMIDVDCPQCNLVQAKKKLLQDTEASARAELKGKGILLEEQIEKFLKPILAPHNEWLRTNNKDNKWYINCVTLDGKLAMLQIPNKSKITLDKKIEDARVKYKVEPISNFDTGVYFQLRRDGNFNNATFACEIYKEATGEGANMVERLKLAPLSDEILAHALEILPDLKTGVTRKISAEQIKLLTECSRDPAEVATIMDMNQLPDQASGSFADDEGGGDFDLPPGAAPALPPASAAPAAPKPAPLSAAAPAAAQAAAAAPSAEDARKKLEVELRAQFEAEMAAKLAALAAQAAAATPAPAPVAAAPVTPAPAATQPAATEAAPAQAATGPALDPMDPNVTPEQFAAMFNQLPTSR